MAQQLKISSLSSKTITTKYGDKEQWVINGKWSAFKGSWNTDWAVGGIAKGVFEQKAGSNGKTYYNISCPPELKKQFSGGMNNQVLSDILKELKEIKAIMSKTDNDAQSFVEEESAVQDEEAEEQPQTSSNEEQVNVDEIPF